ncbi:MAG: polyprenyl diphosphate synthase [Patescibacteria group bacterium]|jgi:tritrans,polycis-undecaprenyl-diphosphate synthase [geranylgeranyl-diphosphate specific]
MENSIAVPKHIGVILDGNRRWAKEHHLPSILGHNKGKDNVINFLRWSRAHNVKEVTFYSFSMQNFSRPIEEVKYLMKLFERAFKEYSKHPEVHKYKVGLNIIGRTYLFPEKVQQALNAALQATREYEDFRVNFAIGYGGREEIVDAVKSIVKKCANKLLSIEKIDEKEVRKHLYLDSDPDLIIRTGGEHRTSNFLPWQSTYSEWFFVNKSWPDFNKEDLDSIIEDFTKRERRFGA